MNATTTVTARTVMEQLHTGMAPIPVHGSAADGGPLRDTAFARAEAVATKWARAQAEYAELGRTA